MKTVLVIVFATIVTASTLDASQQKVHVYELSERDGEAPHVKLLDDNDQNAQLNEDNIDQLLQQINEQQLRSIIIKANKNNMKRNRNNVIKPAYISQYSQSKQNNRDDRKNSEFSSNKQRNDRQFISWKNPYSKIRSRTQSKNQNDNRFLVLDSLLTNLNSQGSIWDSNRVRDYKYRSGTQSRNQKDSNVVDLYNLFNNQDSLESWNSNWAQSNKYKSQTYRNTKDNKVIDLSSLFNNKNSESIWDKKLSNRDNQNSKRESRFISRNDQNSYWDKQMNKKDRQSKNQDRQHSNRGSSNWYNQDIIWDDQYSNKGQEDNNWHDQISDYINRQTQQNYKRNQRNDKKYQRVSYGEDLADFFGEDREQRNAALLSDLLGSTKRDKREVERQDIIKRIKKLVKQLKQFDDNNESRLDGTVYATKGDINKDFDERRQYNNENNKNSVSFLALRSGGADENDDLDTLIEDRTMPPRGNDIFAGDY